MSHSVPAGAGPLPSPDVLNLLEQDAQRQPQWADVQNRWGLVLLLQGRLSEACLAFSLSLERNPKYAWAALNRAQCLISLGDEEKARQSCLAARETKPAAAAFVGATVELRSGRPDRGEKILRALPDETLRRPDFLLLRAALKKGQGRTEARQLESEAWKRFRRDIGPDLLERILSGREDTGPSLVPGLHELWLEVSTLEFRLGRAGTAAEAAARAYLHWADQAAYSLQRGFLAWLADDEARAVQFYQDAARLAPQDPRPFISLAYQWSLVGDRKQARKALTAAIDLAPEYADLHEQLGLLDRAEGRHQEALASFTRALEINPDYEAARLNLAATQFALGRWDEARATYSRVLADGLISSDIHLHLGQAEEELGNLDAAQRNYNDALGLNPEDPEVHYRLGRLYRRRGRMKRARESLQRVLTLSTDKDLRADAEGLLRRWRK